ncbi:MAG: DNRLRE domain-containing protein [Caldilineaceae bacterium]
MPKAISRRWRNVHWFVVFMLFSLLTAPGSAADPVLAQEGAAAQNFPDVPRIHVPFVPETSGNDPVRFAETAIFWFGQVNGNENYADTRIGYNNDLLYIYTAAFDRQMWYNPAAADRDTLTDWDAVTFYLTTGDNATRYRITAQVTHWQEGAAYQAAWQDDGSGWAPSNLDYSVQRAWRGDLPNDNSADERGWAISAQIPFAALGLSGPPAADATWRFGVTVHDRDGAAGPVRAPKIWPRQFAAEDVDTWGELVFAPAIYNPPTVNNPQSITIADKLQGASAPDAAVGGGAICGDGLDFWDEWGDTNYAGRADFNIQNQSDIADWPCYSKYYVTFPLDQLPPAQGIVSATLTLHLFGNAGGGDWGDPIPSLIQVGIADQAWDEGTITWNNAPYLLENVSATWVSRVTEPPAWPGIPYRWDVTHAVADAYARGIPLRLVLYSADSQYHSGKYFVSADTGDWNAAGRPSLTVTYGDVDASATPTATFTPSSTPAATSTPTATSTSQATPTSPASTPTATATATLTPQATGTPTGPQLDHHIYLPELVLDQ